MKELEKKVTRKRNIISRHTKELGALLKTCTHEGYIEQKSSYYSGSYSDHAYTRYWNQCMFCGERGPETIKDHGYYG